MKRIWAIPVLLCLLLIFSGCQKKTELEFAYTTSEISSDPVVICVDLENFDSEGKFIRDAAMNDLIYRLENTAGLTDVAIQFIPPKGTERKTYIDRIRIEMMSGGGPDVFLMAYNSGVGNEDALNLFEYPQKVMESSMFLPLDEYMENHSRFTEWDKQTEGVMAAGRNEEGQQIVPLAYTLPVIVYDQADCIYSTDRELSWNDMINDPEFSQFALDLANCYDYVWSGEEGGFSRYYMEYILGELADFETEELLFTEEELLQRTREILALDIDDVNDVPEQDYYSAVEVFAGLSLSVNSFNKPITLIPMYCDDGGVTATISAYAAVNRNTQYPEEAFSVIDILMSREMQQNSHFYSSYIWGDLNTLLMHEDLFQKDSAANRSSYYLIDENFQELCEVRDQITGANFRGRYREVLNENLLLRCRKAANEGAPIEEIVHEVYEDLQRRVKE